MNDSPSSAAPLPHGQASFAGRAVVALVPDLLLGTRIQDVITAQDGQPIMTETAEAFVVAVDRHFPVLALLDLDASGDWTLAIQRLKARPHSKPVPLYAFGSHVDVETLRAARAAGADHAWARSRLMGSLVEVVARHLDPPVRYPDGWDEPLPPLAQQGVAAFNRGEFYPQHDFFEEAWMDEPREVRDLYQGILQVGVGFYQMQRGNWPGAVKLMRRGLLRLRDLPDVCQGINLAEFRAAAEQIHAEVSAGGPESLAGFDEERFPRIELVEQTAE